MQEIKRETFIKQLESVVSGTVSKELLEQSSCFIFTKGRIVTFNDVITASVPTELKLKGAVPADALLKLLKKIKDEDIKVSQDGPKIYIKGRLKKKDGDYFEAEFNTNEEIIIPIDDIGFPEKFTKLPTNFRRLVKLACMTAGTALGEPLLLCIHICKDKIESCDNDRITIGTFDKALKMDVLVHAQTIAEVNRQEITAVAVLDGWLHFKEKSGAVLSCRLVDEKYINLKQYLPEGKGKKITFPDEVKHILDRADVFCRAEDSLEKRVSLRLSDKGLVLTSQNTSGKYTERKKLKKYNGPKISFEDINPDFLKDVLSLSNTVTLVDGSIVFQDKDAIHVVKLDEGD